ncbi:hypothetical protein BABINDRAFT_148039 [Babjeviella inositovora NRRL Y-12698]|uniref:Uncharacterized protein n=1 Tax=Babjeviella inositovora NRRL Y-12698 TaxID=984486 RepID=A0A1E3QN47_9ASCO|nr:uncharacterized protein BABINDRAFT_148039 [Babjeviella inositovora NRRL Y-12698]ODQ79103.1 hypothetical protein BABINDRAFT_148039 [Babjeviella inositovora NRRL Y-12698]
MRPPTSLEDLLYQTLMKSASFHKFVQTIHAKINGIPPPGRQPAAEDVRYQYSTFAPTPVQKITAFRKVWWVEFKHCMGLK